MLCQLLLRENNLKEMLILQFCFKEELKALTVPKSKKQQNGSHDESITKKKTKREIMLFL